MALVCQYHPERQVLVGAADLRGVDLLDIAHMQYDGLGVLSARLVRRV